MIPLCERNARERTDDNGKTEWLCRKCNTWKETTTEYNKWSISARSFTCKICKSALCGARLRARIKENYLVGLVHTIRQRERKRGAPCFDFSIDDVLDVLHKYESKCGMTGTPLKNRKDWTVVAIRKDKPLSRTNGFPTIYRGRKLGKLLRSADVPAAVRSAGVHETCK